LAGIAVSVPIFLVLAAMALVAFDYFQSGAADIGDGSEVLTNYSPSIQLFARAIAAAEGFGTPGSLPTQCNNPGDLTAGDWGDTGQYRTSASGAQIIVYPAPETGWAALCEKLQNIANGGSSAYSAGMTIAQMAAVYVGTSNYMTWASNVAAYLGASVNDAIGSYLS
jgi:hypothetical protein